MKSTADMTVHELMTEIDRLRSEVAEVPREDGSRAVLVCTDKKGVFFGHTADNIGDDVIHLTGVRMCIYWTKTGGVLGLQESGPGPSCRIGAQVSSSELPGCGVTYIGDCTTQAAALWEGAPTYDAG